MGPPPTLCTHLAGALATSTGELVYTRCVRETHGDMHAAASLAAPAGPCRGYNAENVRATPGGPQKHIKIEFTRCPGRCEAHPSLSLSSGHEDVALANDVRGDVGRRCVYDRRFGEGKGYDSPPELVRPSARASLLSPREEKEDESNCKVKTKLTLIVISN